MRVKDLMTKEVFTLNPHHNLSLAQDMMDWQRIRHIPVVDRDGNLVGLVTHRDLLKAAISSLAEISQAQQDDLNRRVKVEQIMQRQVTSIEPEATLNEAAEVMFNGKFGCLPVTEGKKLKGIITEADFITLAWRTGAFE